MPRKAALFSIGTFRHFAAPQQAVAFEGEADMAESEIGRMMTRATPIEFIGPEKFIRQAVTVRPSSPAPQASVRTHAKRSSQSGA